MNSILDSRSNAEKHCKQLQITADNYCSEFNGLANVSQPLNIQIKVTSFPMGYGLTADLNLGDQLLKHYPLAEEALIDVNALTLNQLRRKD